MRFLSIIYLREKYVAKTLYFTCKYKRNDCIALMRYVMFLFFFFPFSEYGLIYFFIIAGTTYMYITENMYLKIYRCFYVIKVHYRIIIVSLIFISY